MFAQQSERDPASALLGFAILAGAGLVIWAIYRWRRKSRGKGNKKSTQGIRSVLKTILHSLIVAYMTIGLGLIIFNTSRWILNSDSQTHIMIGTLCCLIALTPLGIWWFMRKKKRR